MRIKFTTPLNELGNMKTNFTIKSSQESRPLFQHGEVVINSKGVVAMICSTNVANKAHPLREDKVKVLSFSDGLCTLCEWQAKGLLRFSGELKITQ